MTSEAFLRVLHYARTPWDEDAGGNDPSRRIVSSSEDSLRQPICRLYNLFSDTEAREQPVQDILDADMAADLAE